MHRQDRWRRAGLLLLGFCTGLLLLAVGARIWLRGGRELAQARTIRTELNLPAGVFELEEVPRRGQPLRATVRNVVLLDPDGDTIAVAPQLRLVVDPASLAGDGPVVLRDVELRSARIRLVQSRGGEWNFARVARVQAGGQDVGGEGRGVVLRDVRVLDSRATLVQYQNGERQSRTIQGLAARLPLVRAGGGAWRVDVASLAGVVPEFDMRIAQLRGTIESAPRDAIRFAIREFRTNRSALSGEGTVRFAGDFPQVVGTFRADPLDFRDLVALGLPVPEEGRATFALRAEARSGGRTAWIVRDAQVAALESRIAGAVTVITGGGRPMTFGDTRLRFDPLNLADLERLGLVDEIPFTGPVRGTLASAEGDAFRLDLVGTVTPRAGGPASTIAADGLLALADGTGADRIQLRGLRVSGQPLNLATLASLFPEQRDRLQGTLTGGATLFGSPRNLRIEDGDLTYVVGDAPPTRLTNATGRVALDPELRFDLRARAEPLALGTLAELFPALPIRDARVTGPIALSGTAQAVRFDVDLAGDLGGLAARGRVALGEVPRFDVEGTLRGFRPDRLVPGGTPMEGPLSGRFAVDGTTQDFRFDVDLTEAAAGRFALEGRVRRGAAGAPQFEAAGEVTNFRLGALIGRPGLFPSPMTGKVALTGGGQQAYRFNVDLRGAIGLLDLRGWYLPGTVPSYAFAGRVVGLDVSGLPGFASAPETSLTATVDIQGRGLTPETFAGRANIVAAPSVVGGMPLDAALVRLAAEGGILRVDTLALAMGGTQINAAGQWGLTRPAPEPLRFSGYSPDLRTLAALIPPPGRFEPQLSGSAAFSGTVGGTLANPVIAANLRGRALRYEAFRADTLAIDLRARREGAGWAGNVTALGDRVVLPGGRSFDAFRLESTFTPRSASLGLFAGRDPQTAISVSAVLDLQPGGFRGVRGAEIETLVLRLGPDTWQLAGPTRVRWGGATDLEVERLVLRRTGDAPGLIEVDGRLATTGPLDLRLRVGGIDLAEVRRLVPTLPEMRGTIAMEAAFAGTAANPLLTVEASLDSVRYGGAEAERVTFRARYADRRATVDGLVRVLGSDIARFGGTVPMELTLTGTVPGMRLLDTQPLHARIEADSLPLGLLAAAIPGVTDGEGIAAARITVTGTPARPLVAGGVALSRGAVTIEALGTRYQDIEARLALDGRRVRVDSLFLRNEGTAQVTGSVLLEELTRPRLDLVATFNRFQAIEREDVAALELTGRVALRGRLPEPSLTGRITLEDGSIAIPELSRRRPIDIATADIGDLGADTIPIGPPSPAVAVLAGLRVENLEVAIGDNLWLRSPDANIQMGGEVTVSRVGPENRINGTLEAVRGSYSLRIGPLTREFDIVRGTVQFFGTGELNPALNILARNEVRTFERGQTGVLEILVQVAGTMQNPTIQLTSNTRPPLPESELLNYLAFGRSTTELGGATGSLAQELIAQELLGGLILQPLEQGLLRTGLVDYVRIRAGTSDIFGGALLGSTAIEAGRQIARNLYLTATVFEVGGVFGGAATPQLGLGLDYQITRESSLRAALEPVRRDRLFQLGTVHDNVRYQFSTDYRRRWEYGLPADPKPIRLPRRPEAAPTPPDTTRRTPTP